MKKKVKYSIIPMVLSLLLMAGGLGLAQEKKSSETGDRESSYGQQQEEQKTQQSEMKQQKWQAQKEEVKTEPGQEKTAKEKMGKEAEPTTQSKFGKQEKLTNYRPLVGREVRSTGGDEIGWIENVLVSEDGKEINAVVGVGGFLGMGEKQVLVTMNDLRFDPATEYVTYRGTEKDLEALTEYKAPRERGEYARRRPYAPDSSQQWGYYGPRGRDYDERMYRGEERRGYTEPGRYGRDYYEERQGSRYPYREERFGQESERGYQGQYPGAEERYGRRYDEREGRYYSPESGARYESRYRDRYPSGEDRYRQRFPEEEYRR